MHPRPWGSDGTARRPVDRGQKTRTCSSSCLTGRQVWGYHPIHERSLGQHRPPVRRDLDPDDVPKIVSVDDHVIEPPDVWTSRLPSKYADVMAPVRAQRGTMNFVGGVFTFEHDRGRRRGRLVALRGQPVPAHPARGRRRVRPRRGQGRAASPTRRCARAAGTRPPASRTWTRTGPRRPMCFPSASRASAVRRFNEAKDKELADLCVKAYNDWRSRSGAATRDGRLIPLHHRAAVGRRSSPPPRSAATPPAACAA